MAKKNTKNKSALKSTPDRTRHKGGTKDRKHGMWQHEQKAHHPHHDDDEHHDNGSSVSMFSVATWARLLSCIARHGMTLMKAFRLCPLCTMSRKPATAAAGPAAAAAIFRPIPNSSADEKAN